MPNPEKEHSKNLLLKQKIKTLLNCPAVEQNMSLKDLYNLNISRKICELMASGFTIDVDPKFARRIGIWGLFRYLNVVHSKKDDTTFFIVEGFKPKIENYFDEPFTYIAGIYRNVNESLRIDCFIEKDTPVSKVYTTLITLNNEEVSEELEEDKLFFVQCTNKLLNDLEDSVPDDDSTMEDFDTRFPCLNREWLSEVENIDSNTVIM